MYVRAPACLAVVVHVLDISRARRVQCSVLLHTNALPERCTFLPRARSPPVRAALRVICWGSASTPYPRLRSCLYSNRTDLPLRRGNKTKTPKRVQRPTCPTTNSAPTRVQGGYKSRCTIPPHLLRGTIVNRTCGIRKSLPRIYLTIFTNNIWSY